METKKTEAEQTGRRDFEAVSTWCGGRGSSS